MKYFSFLAKKISLLELLPILIYIKILDYMLLNAWAVDDWFHILLNVLAVDDWFDVLFLWLIPSVLTWLLYELFLFILTKIKGKKGKKIKWRFLYIPLIIPLGYLAFYSVAWMISLFIGIP